ncbi:MAG: hypothetical protein UX02_C0002G0192 [Candidatus Moranbacteria bacterium GW2011_GWC1_45_18]|nr:MAG: hypothetical protein UT79_C0001G0269 [Candidatus Moranbacteria bacterium GW2011_GWC2_40_12]KKT32796.1 MAG: hypothetical protein UW19_C0015G0004 [Candidatus Moranbacteria bacterium GW2011_GWF2_44_10]KKT99873.1 MAG: hypothetical protein UX02_C0002G0192 [Candidatus Moranbacteria bacterium GW2011_GWC1_45_18]OGI22554.1 MAG: hypothetical protein A2194_03665 [Candidatus Moranbacteria bacterium RIFOXYA1_FULL_44_8]OGI34403.1 MAG: hypothetical protein A2407_04130 [Candidatus Moranbacteria bacteri
MKKKKVLSSVALLFVFGAAGFVFAKSESAQNENPSRNVSIQGNRDEAPGSGAGNSGQSQNQNKNREKIEEKNKNAGPAQSNQEKSNEQSARAANAGQANADTHRSAVVSFVKNLLEAAKNEDGKNKNGIGGEVRNVAMQQNQGEAVTVTAMEQVQARGKIQTFLIGSDYKSLGALRSEMVQTRNRIRQLEGLASRTENEETRQKLEEQIREFEQEQARINQFISENDSRISLFGWLAKIFQ